MSHRKIKAFFICSCIFLLNIIFAMFVPFLYSKVFLTFLVLCLVFLYRQIINAIPTTEKEKNEYKIIQEFKNNLISISDKGTLIEEIIKAENTTKYFYKEYKDDLFLLIDELRYKYKIENENNIILNKPLKDLSLVCQKCNYKIGLTYKSLDEKKINCPKCKTLFIWGVPKKVNKMINSSQQKI